MWCSECKEKGILNELYVINDYYYCDVCEVTYNKKMQVVRSKKEKEIN